jgi:alpha-galactosidase/6-phospho-beta-glucosidase family protein
MTISLNNDKLKRLALYAVWTAVIIASAFVAYKYLPLNNQSPPQYAIVRVGELIKEEQARLTTENFLTYRQNQDIELAAQAYYEKIKRIANAIAKQENIIIFDDGAIIGLPSNGAIDITPFIKRELGLEQFAIQK